MRKALHWTLPAAALLFAAALHQTAIAQPFAAPAIGASAPELAFANARLICAPYWWGHFECARVCPVAHRRWHHHRYYYCQPMVLGLPWV